MNNNHKNIFMQITFKLVATHTEKIEILAKASFKLHVILNIYNELFSNAFLLLYKYNFDDKK